MSFNNVEFKLQICVTNRYFHCFFGAFIEITAVNAAIKISVIAQCILKCIVFKLIKTNCTLLTYQCSNNKHAITVDNINLKISFIQAPLIIAVINVI